MSFSEKKYNNKTFSYSFHFVFMLVLFPINFKNVLEIVWGRKKLFTHRRFPLFGKFHDYTL